MFKELNISDFRGIGGLKLKDMSKLNLVVGANNSGKTTILESLFLLVGVSNSQLPLKINSFRFFDLIGDVSWKSFFRDLNLDNTIILDAEFDDKSKRNLKIKPHTLFMQTIKDRNGVGTSSTSTPEINGLILEATISNRDKKKIKSEIWVDLEKGEHPLVINLAKDYKELRKGIFISDRTKNELSDRFDNIQRRKEKSQVIDILKNLEPNLKDIALGQGGIVYVDLGLDNLVPIQLMGDGMVKILAVVLAIMDTKDGVVLIDEIENGLHFKSQEILWNAIAKTSEKYNVQIIAATHSIENIRAFSNVLRGKTKGSLYRIETDGKQHKSIYFSQEKIRSFVESNWEMR